MNDKHFERSERFEPERKPGFWENSRSIFTRKYF